jgi:hypothetical protein
LEQVDEKTFKMWMPDGWHKYFWRDAKDKNVLRSGGGWAAQIQGDTITTWADCGWKVVYTRGKITSIYTPQGNVLTYNYTDNNQVADLRDRGSVIMRVKRNQEGEIAGLEMSGQSIGLEYGQKPQIQTINGQRLIRAMNRSVSKITQVDGMVKTFEYGTSSTLEPTLKIDGERLLTWDPQSK